MIRVYLSNITWFTSAEYSTLRKLLKEDDQKEILRFRLENDQKRGILSKIGLYKVLKMFGAEPSMLQSNQYGKKYINIEGKKAKHFNISHSGDWVVHVVSEQEVGVDVEEMKVIEYHALSSFFAQEDRQYLRMCLASELPEEFYRIWTSKEAYVKYLGLGLNKNLKSFYTTTEERAKKEATIQSWQLGNYILSVCTREEEMIQIDTWGLKEERERKQYIGQKQLRKISVIEKFY